jgi:hypothetical protein
MKVPAVGGTPQGAADVEVANAGPWLGDSVVALL